MKKSIISRCVMNVSGAARGRRMCTLAIQETKARNETNLPLYRRLSALGITGESVSKTMNEYVREGKTVRKNEIESCVKQLRKFKRYHHALELMEWMETRGNNLSYSDYAVRLDLLSKTKGLNKAVEYFDNLPDLAKNHLTYGALLNCYCKNENTEKALDLFEKMSEKNIASTLAFNNLMTLHMKLGEPEKVPLLLLEMKEKSISPDTFTYNIVMASHAATKDIEGVERVLKEMETKDSERCDWSTYSNLASIYIKAGTIDKANLALIELEKKMKPSYRTAYHFLISLYASTSNLSEVHRVWSSLKSALPTTNNLSYLVMLQSLSKLDDLDGLTKCFKDWETSCSSYDMRLVNTVVSAYLRRDMVKEARLICEDAIKRGPGLNYRTHELFMDFFIRNLQLDSALSCMEACISIVKKKKKNEWKPTPERVMAFLKHCEKQKNVTDAEEFCKMLKNVDCLDSNAYCLLLSTYIAANKKEPGMRKRLEMDCIKVTLELEELLEKVCMQ
ncbi:hypothetical protein IFM89_009587 [Coptis chinensis]|uniref:Pentatricopeptide repeat-containing protein n=1 Tax=Coptis chinensis TaxID=261450 RepID=A0A835ILA1_9MAGN|nr:hypothetical protein IFM89_009587 [Coptis chinensis]